MNNNTTDIKLILTEKDLDNNYQKWQDILQNIESSEVERVLATPPGTYNLEKLIVLISPAAESYLEQMAQISQQLTIQRFGKTIKLYAPLYLSNYCTNNCRYCGFNKEHKFNRTRLTIDQALADAEVIASEGFKDILLVSSEDKKFIDVKYLSELASKLRDKFSSISIEIYPMNTAEYSELFKAGIEGVTLYQETYNRQVYSNFHTTGPKSDFDERLYTHDRAATAGMREIGLGVLLGLTDWRVETLALAEHAHCLMKRYWQSHISFSFPRLRPAYEIESADMKYFPSDKNLVQMITALRLCFADAGLVLSTREGALLRDHLIKLGITKLSAGSKTNPGGYSGSNTAIKQFEIDDKRNPAKVAEMIKKAGFEPVWKDWDSCFTKR
ncbi:MAG: 2-iminoacetate synthase ThiH [Bacteroidales bacterium]|nr:2-iminoacetate synthase ThiH [Bacteroidales bacterium]